MRRGITTKTAQRVRAARAGVGAGCLLMAFASIASAQTNAGGKKDPRYDTNVTIQNMDGNVPDTPLSDPGGMIPTSEVPDVHIVIAPQGQAWYVSAVYSKKVPRAKAEERTKRLLDSTGWKGENLTFDEGQVTSMLSNDPSGLSPVMSSSTFTTTAPLIDPKDGAVALEPILLAYSDLQRVYVTFLAPKGVTPHGPKEVKDDNIFIFARPEPGALTYVTKIRNHNAKTFGLPRLEASPVTPASGGSAEPKSGSGIWLGALGALALAAGGAAYALIARRKA